MIMRLGNLRFEFILLSLMFFAKNICSDLVLNSASLKNSFYLTEMKRMKSFYDIYDEKIMLPYQSKIPSISLLLSIFLYSVSVGVQILWQCQTIQFRLAH